MNQSYSQIIEPYLADRKYNTARAYRNGLNNFALLFDETIETMNWLDISNADLLVEGIEEMQSQYSYSKTNVAWGAIRGLLTFMWKTGIIDNVRMSEIRRAIPTFSQPKDYKLVGRLIQPHELVSMFNACEDYNETLKLRNRALLAVLWCTGARRNAICRLNYGNVDLDNAYIAYTAKKNNKECSVYLNQGAIRHLSAWMELRPDADPEAPLFIRIWKSGGFGGRLGKDAIMYTVQELAEKANIPPITPHDFRKTFISTMFENGVDASTITSMTGHSKIESLRKYDLRKVDLSKITMEF